MATNPIQYPLDLTGTNPRNKVSNEVRTINRPEERIFVPSGGPFFSKSLMVTNVTTGQRLAPITDFKAVELHNEATIASGEQICTVVLITNNTVTNVRIDYQVIGGQYSEVTSTLRDLLTHVDFNNLKTINWAENVYGKPEVYPPAAHRHPGHEFAGWNRFNVALNNICRAIVNKNAAAMEAVYAYIDSTIATRVTNINVDTSNLATRIALENAVTTLNNTINTVKGLFYTKVESDGRYAKKTDIPAPVNVTEITNNVTTRINQAIDPLTTKYNELKGLVDRTVTRVGANEGKITNILTEITNLKNAIKAIVIEGTLIQTVRVGGSTDFAVNAFKGIYVINQNNSTITINRADNWKVGTVITFFNLTSTVCTIRMTNVTLASRQTKPTEAFHVDGTTTTYHLHGVGDSVQFVCFNAGEWLVI